jgi:two-component system response regulator PilR (NtrC family)
MKTDPSHHALIVDDEPDIGELISLTLNQSNIQCDIAYSVAEAKKKLTEKTYHFCLSDYRLPDSTGLELVKHINHDYPTLPIAIITAHGNMETAVEALKIGAFDFVSKPIDIGKLRQLTAEALKLTPIDQENNATSIEETRLVGYSGAICQLKETICKVSRTQAPIYITGPSGCGKELVAKIIHQKSPRHAGPFIAINCGAIPSALLESELFGHSKGSFTGATKNKIGLFQAANGGTLFLDEIAELPLEMQVKLLRAIQEKSIRPVGEIHELPIDVRFISATHQDLSQLLTEHKFREDLYYRINVIQLKVPSLSQRKEDIPVLCDHILNLLANNNQSLKPILTQDALNSLLCYPFPGNVRELENILERAFALSNGKFITIEDLALATPENKDYANQSEIKKTKSLDLFLQEQEQQEKESILGALTQTQGNKTKAAELLGMSFRTLRYRIKKFGLQ